MGGMGPLGENQRYVVTIEIPGLKSAEDAEKINRIVQDLKQRFGASLKLEITGSK